MLHTSSGRCRYPLSALRRVTRALVVAGLFLPASLAAQKVDSLVMINDDVITGELKELTRGKLSYKTDDMGTLSIKWDKVKRLKTTNYYQIEVESGWKYFGSLAWPAEDYRVVVVLTEADTLDMHDVVSISRIRAGFFQRTSGYVDLGFSVMRANRQTEWTLGAQVKYRAPKWAGSLTGNSYFRFQEDTASNTSRNNLAGRADRVFKNKWSIGLTLSVEQNEELNLDLRQITGLGGGYSVTRTNDHTLRLNSSLLATNEKYSTSADGTTSMEVLFAADFQAFRFDSPKLDLTTSVSVTPSISDLGRVRTQWDFRTSYELIADFYVGLKGFITYDSRPPTEDAVKADYSVNFTIGWSWS
jgi:hypothetical protein